MEIEFLDKGNDGHRNGPCWKPPQPHHIQHDMTPHHGLHMNLVYFAIPKNPRELSAIVGEDEDSGEELRWVTLEEMSGLEFIESVRSNAAEAIREAENYVNPR